VYKIKDNFVIRIADGTIIPMADGNMDYEAYKIWIAAGNSPVEDLAEIKANKMSELYSAYVNARTSIVWTEDGFGFDADESSQNDFVQAFKTAEILDKRGNNKGDTPCVPYRLWTSPTTKEIKVLTLTQFENAQIAGSNVAFAAFQKFDGLRTQVGLAASKEAVTAITW
jgi:hypothetical protein